jgi:DNA-binding NtrC family response regulator
VARPNEMDARTNLLILSRDFSLFESVRKAAPAESANVLFCQPEEDYVGLMREHGIKVVLLDSAGDLKDLTSVLKKLKGFDPLVDVVILGPAADSETILDLIHRGAVDYLVKPLLPGTIKRVLGRIEDKRALRRETFQLEKKLEKKYVFQGMISRSPAMLEVFALVENIAGYFSSALITGDTGTGKELVARAIHALGPTRDKPLVVCDCASIPENLFESELFGYRKGAFTGADRDKKGLFEEADQGTIFLDEIAEIPVAVQSKLLRILENRQFRPLGSNENKDVDVRMIAATNRDLGQAIKSGAFREDLFHRLNRVEIHLPPLRERMEDVPLLVRHFTRKFAEAFSKDLRGVSREAQKVFLRYRWPGNVRELENVLESASMLCRKDFIEVSNLPRHLRDLDAPGGPLALLGREGLSTLEDLEKEYIGHLLKVTGGNLRKTAGILGISRTTLYNKMAKFELARRKPQNA